MELRHLKYFLAIAETDKLQWLQKPSPPPVQP